MTAYFAERRKAIAAFIAPAIPLLLMAVQESSPGGDSIVQSEWITALLTCVAALCAVHQVTNQSPPVEVIPHIDTIADPPYDDIQGMQ